MCLQRHIASRIDALAHRPLAVRLGAYAHDDGPRTVRRDASGKFPAIGPPISIETLSPMPPCVLKHAENQSECAVDVAVRPMW
jgi:hypothetical protein